MQLCHTVLPLLLAAPLVAQPKRAAKPLPARHDAVSSAPQQLPLRRVALYKNGVGFFEHKGIINGTESVRIDFTSAQLNDVLQTLTAIDLGGGHITGAGYNSTTPVDQQLKNLPIALSADPTAADFYQAIRGAHVEVTGSGAPITGRILNVELRTITPAKGDSNTPGVEKHFLTVVSDAGAVRTIELGSNTSVRLLEGSLRDGVNRYLQVLDATRSDGLRHLSLTDKGTGTRQVRLSYISEVPIWKSTYRILFDKKDTAILQGWAVVDNTIGTDWENVQLSLIAGAPQSFIQPISQAYYSRRPEVPLPEEAQLTPQTHESGDEKSDRFTGSISPKMISGAGSGRGYGIGAGQGGSVAAMNVNAMAAPLSYEDSAVTSTQVAATSKSFDHYFEYKLTEPITLRRNESMLVPILTASVPTERVTLWSESQPTPLRALWITNTSNLSLDRGSFSIVEAGNFGGQGLLDPIHPGEKRLLSYAADQAVRVTSDGRARTTRRLQQITISKGLLTEKTLEIAERGYLVDNAASEERTVIVEHQRHSGWQLDSDPKPAEETTSLYRFKIMAQPNESVRLHVGERHTLAVKYALANFTNHQLDMLLEASGDMTPAAQQELRNRLAPVVEARRRVSDIDAQIADRNRQIGAIGEDQKRLRDNMAALKGSAEERDLIKRYTGEMNVQEDKLAALHKEVEQLQANRANAQSDLDKLVQSMEWEQTV